MIILFIKEKGKFINLTGIAPFRTPAEVDITKLNINLVVKELRRSGVNDYQITYKNHDKKPTFKKPITKDESNFKLLEKVEKIDKLEKMIEELLNKNNQPTREIIIEKHIINESKSVNKNIINKEINNEKMFVPSIDPNELSMKGSTKYKSIKNKENIQENIELLRKLGNKNNE